MRPMFCFIKGDRGPRHCFIFQIQRNFHKLKIPFQDTASIETRFLA
jgi:hypothetical protein